MEISAQELDKIQRLTIGDKVYIVDHDIIHVGKVVGVTNDRIVVEESFLKEIIVFKKTGEEIIFIHYDDPPEPRYIIPPSEDYIMKLHLQEQRFAVDSLVASLADVDIFSVPKDDLDRIEQALLSIKDIINNPEYIEE